MIWQKRNIFGQVTEKAEEGDLIITSVKPNQPSYFWAGSKNQSNYYRNAKLAKADEAKPEDLYLVGHSFNWKIAIIIGVFLIIIYYKFIKK